MPVRYWDVNLSRAKESFARKRKEETQGRGGHRREDKSRRPGPLDICQNSKMKSRKKVGKRKVRKKGTKPNHRRVLKV